MYDRKNDANEFVADTTEEATKAAARFYEVDASELRISQAPAGEIYGLGARAVIVAIPKNATPPKPGGGGGERSRDDRGGRDRDRGDRGDRGGRGRGRERSDRGERGGREQSNRAEAEESPQAIASKATLNGEVGEVGQFVAGVVERMKLGDLEVSESTEDDMVVIQVSGAATEKLRSGDGRGVDALQLLASQAAKRIDDDAPRVVVDVGGESGDRDDSLRELVQRALKRAQTTKRSIALDPMNGRDRRIIHLAIEEEDGVATMSIGTGRFRQVLVVPEGADEYKEALESAESAAS